MDYCVQAIGLIKQIGAINAQFLPLLVRTQSIEEKSRSQELHEATISVCNQDKVPLKSLVIVLDDIWTTGSTMRACRVKLIEAFKPTKESEVNKVIVKLFAIGRTQPRF